MKSGVDTNSTVHDNIDRVKNTFEHQDIFNNNTNSDLCEVTYKFSIIPSVSETETVSSDISLGDSDDADDDLTDTSETLDNDSTTEEEPDDMTEDPSSPPSLYSLYTIVEEDECICEGPVSSPDISDLQQYFLLLGNLQQWSWNNVIFTNTIDEIQ